MNDIKGKIYAETGLCYPRITVTEGIEKEFKLKVAKVEQEVFQAYNQVYTTLTTETGGPGNFKVNGSKTRNQRKIGGCFFSCFSSNNNQART
jgi:predicted Rdx family selenoprotein